jgi:Recombinase zinc beta ribbon domain/Recombinase
MRGIAMLLNDEGVPTPSQVSASNGHLGRHRVGERWAVGTVQRILIDRTYLGEWSAYKWQRTRSTNGKVGHAKTDEAVRVALSVPALVDPETFSIVQSNMSSHKPSGRPPIDAEASWLRGHVYCGVCGSRMSPRRNLRTGLVVYHCNRATGSSNNGIDCPGGSFSIHGHKLDEPVYEALGYLLARKESVRDLMLKRLGTDKRDALASMAEGYAAQIAEKRELLETARRRALQTSDDELAQSFIHAAEELNGQIHTLEKDYAEASEELDDFHADNAWVDATLRRIYERSSVLDVEEVKAFPYDDRRVLLAATGLRAEVYPKNWPGLEPRTVRHVTRTEEWVEELPPNRVRVVFSWEKQQALDAQMSHPSPGWRRRSARHR